MTVFDGFKLDGRKALVTGSSRGIGKAIAMALGDAGAEVMFHGSAPSAKLDSAVDEAMARGNRVRKAVADLGKRDEVSRLLSEAGDIDILVLNASVQKYQSLERFEPDEFARQFQVNVASSLQLIEGVIPAMRAKGWGRVLAIGSVNHFRPAARLPIYSATKSAFDSIIRNAAKSYGECGITFNTISPGVITTDRNAAVLSDPNVVAGLLSSIPARRFGKSEDCGALALLLCSEAGSYITGANIPVTGGMHL